MNRASLESTPPPTALAASSALAAASAAAAGRRQRTLRKLPAFLRPPKDTVKYAAIFLDVNSREELLCRCVKEGVGEKKEEEV